MRLLWLPDHLREWGLEPIEVDGWRDRGYGDFGTFRPRGFVDHHTAGARTGWAPSLGVVINGRAGIPGPLSQLFTPRNPQGKRNVHVVAAGRANHAGKGGWAGLSGNSSVVGHERENVGTPAEPWQPWQTEDAAVVAACVLDGLGRYEGVATSAALYCEHKEWAPTRKTDAHTIAGAAMRSRIADLLQPPDPIPDPPTPELPNMDFFILNDNNAATQDQWYWWPELGNEKGTKAIIPSGTALTLAQKSPRYSGSLEFDRPDLDAIPNLRG